MRTTVHKILGKLPYIRNYRLALEKAFELMTPEQRESMRVFLHSKGL